MGVVSNKLGVLKPRGETGSSFHSVTNGRQGLKEEPQELIVRKALDLSIWLKWSLCSIRRILT